MTQYRVQNRLDKVEEAVQQTGSASGSTEPEIVAIQQLIVDPETGEPTARYSQLHALLATLMTQDRKIAENTALLGAELQQIDDYNRVSATQFLSTVITETDSIEQTLVQVDEQMLVLIEESAASVQSKQRTAITATSIVGLVALLAGAIASVLLVRRLTRSVRVVSAKAREMRSVVGTDEFVHQDIPVISSDEIGELASVFNEMSANLERNIEVRRRYEGELAEARDEAMRANQAKSYFLANMSHELRTPLNAIIGYSEMLEEEAQELEQDSLIPDLKRINQAGQHLLTLITGVLDLSKIEAGLMDVFVEDFDLNKEVGEVLGVVHPLMKKNSNRLDSNCPRPWRDARRHDQGQANTDQPAEQCGQVHKRRRGPACDRLLP